MSSRNNGMRCTMFLSVYLVNSSFSFSSLPALLKKYHSIHQLYWGPSHWKFHLKYNNVYPTKKWFIVNRANVIRSMEICVWLRNDSGMGKCYFDLSLLNEKRNHRIHVRGENIDSEMFPCKQKLIRHCGVSLSRKICQKEIVLSDHHHRKPHVE